MIDFMSRLVNLIYPKKCISCRIDLPHDDTLMACSRCYRGIEKIDYDAHCRGCACPVDTDNEYCFACRGKVFPYASIYAAVRYKGLVRDYLHHVKYYRRAHLLKILSFLIESGIKDEEIFKRTDALVPVPLHRSRLKKRGFNQSEILAHSLSERFNVPVLPALLKRQLNTRPQFGLKKEERFENIKNAFCMDPSFTGAIPQTVVLIDDICTTGSTVRECARVLRENGVNNISCLVLARD